MRPSFLPQGTSRIAGSVALPLVVAAAVFLLLLYSAGTKDGDSGNPGALINAGQAFVGPKLLPSDAPVHPGTGYDGQFFFYLAQDPLLSGRVATRDAASSPHFDHLGYRYQRILLPVLGWVTSWGEPGVLQWTLPLINLLAVLGSGFLLARLLASRGRSPWLSLVYMLSLGVVVGVARDLSDPLAVSLFVAGVVWWLDQRVALAILALTACLLARELYVIPVAVIALLELLRRRREALPWLLPLVVFVAWQAYLRLALAAPVNPKEVYRPSLIPLLGAVRKLREVARVDWLGAANWEILFVALLLLTPLFFLIRSLLLMDRWRRVRRLPSRDELVFVVGLAAVAILPFLSLGLWRDLPSYARYSAPVGGMLVLGYAVSRDAAARVLMIGLVALSLANPVVALLPISHPEAVQDPSTPP